MMTKIMPEHLARGAFVYVRQSTADQLLHNHESRHRQYGLADRARQLGWQEIIVIDDDLGRSGSGVSRKRIVRGAGSSMTGFVRQSPHPTERVTDQPGIWKGRSPFNATAERRLFGAERKRQTWGLLAVIALRPFNEKEGHRRRPMSLADALAPKAGSSGRFAKSNF
jgi:hypothetical protein